jgi:hypothetical protein
MHGQQRPLPQDLRRHPAFLHRSPGSPSGAVHQPFFQERLATVMDPKSGVRLAQVVPSYTSRAAENRRCVLHAGRAVEKFLASNPDEIQSGVLSGMAVPHSLPIRIVQDLVILGDAAGEASKILQRVDKQRLKDLEVSRWERDAVIDVGPLLSGAFPSTSLRRIWHPRE